MNRAPRSFAIAALAVALLSSTSCVGDGGAGSMTCSEFLALRTGPQLFANDKQKEVIDRLLTSRGVGTLPSNEMTAFSRIKTACGIPDSGGSARNGQLKLGTIAGSWEPGK